MTNILLAAAVGLLVGLVARAVRPARTRLPWWLTTIVGIAAAVLGTAASDLLGAPSSMPAALLAPLLFGAVGVIVAETADGIPKRKPR